MNRGVNVQKGGFLYTACIIFVYTSCAQSAYVLVAGHISHTMQKAVATFVGSVHSLIPFWQLEADARHQRRKLLPLVVGTLLGDADIVVRSDNNSIMIESNEMRELDDAHVSEEVVQILGMVRYMSLSTRNMLKLERQCTRRELLAGRDKFLPYVATALEVSSGFVSRRSAAVRPLVEVVQSQFMLSRACGTFGVPRQDRVLIIVCADATPLWQTSGPKCDVHVIIWSEEVAAAGDVRHWATWWALDGPDATHCLRAIDTKGDLNQQILDVQSVVDVWHLGHHIPSVCALTSDGNAMLCANDHKGKCWVGRSSINCLERASSVPARCRWGSFLRAIGPSCNRVGDVQHGSCRVANAVLKRLNETIKGFIETGASDLAQAAREVGKAMVLELHKILDEVKNVPHAERLAPRPTKALKFDITGGKMFFEDSALHAQVVAALRDNLAEVAFGGVKFFVSVRYVLLHMHRLHALWRKQDWLTQEELKDMEYWCDRLGEVWGKLQWGVTPWVHWADVHNAYFARLWQFVYLPQYSYGLQEPTVQKASQKLDARLVPSAATHHLSRNETCGAHRRLERWFAIV